MPITTSWDNAHSSLNGDLSSYLLNSLDDEDSFVILERSSASRPGSGGTSATPPQPPPHAHQPIAISEQFPVFNNVSTSMMATSRASHSSEAMGSMLPFDTSQFSVSAEEIDKRLQDVLQENISLKENLYQTNLAMKQQLSTVKLLQDRASETQKNHQAKFEETKLLILKLGSEKNELEESNNLLTAELKACKEEYAKLKESNLESTSEVSKLLAENDGLKKQILENQKTMRLMAEIETKSSSQPTPKEVELRDVIDQLTKKLETVERARRQQEFDIEHLQAHVNRVKGELEASQSTLARVTQELTVSQDKLEKITQEFAISQENLSRVTQELNNSQENTARVTHELQSSQEKLGQVDPLKSFELISLASTSERPKVQAGKDVDFLLFKEEILPRSYALINMMESHIQDAQSRKTVCDMVQELMSNFEEVCKDLDRVKADHALKVSHRTAYDELQKKSFMEQLDSLTAKLVEKEEALSIAERHLASLQEAVRLENHEKKEDDNVQLLKSQLNILSNNLEAKDKELINCMDVIKMLRAEIEKLSVVAEKSEILEQQANIYKADFEAERESRESLVAEKDKLSEDLRNLHRRNQELIEELNRYNSAGGEPNAPPLPSDSTSREMGRQQSPPPRNIQNSEIGNKFSIFHEKQDGQLCAQHCINSLLQGPHFNAVDLAELAEEMDFAEKKRFAEAGVDSKEFISFLKKPSENMDDSGFFSVQVISCALELWGLEMVPFNSSDPRVLAVKKDLCNAKAFICNSSSHWFTIRKIGTEWFNLNSTLNKPKHMSEMYTHLLLNAFTEEGNSVFVIFGDLPSCPADLNDFKGNYQEYNGILSEGNRNQNAEQLYEIIKTHSIEDNEQDLSMLFNLNKQNSFSSSATRGQVKFCEILSLFHKWLTIVN